MSDNQDNGVIQFERSAQPEIIRQQQKDEDYLQYLKSLVIDAAEILVPYAFPIRAISRNEDVVKMISTLLYYGMTTLRSQQTLGEEYAQLAQYNKNLVGLTETKQPKLTRGRKLMFVLLASVFPLVYSRIIGKKIDKIKEQAAQDIESGKRATFLKIFLDSMPDSEGMLQQFSKAHFAIFFIEGLFLQFSRRFTGIRLIYTKKPQPHQIHYRNVGLLMGFQLSIELLKFLYRVYKKYRYYEQRRSIANANSDKKIDDIQTADGGQAALVNTEKGNNIVEEENESSEMPEEAKVCMVCFSTRTNTSSTPCGHLFCWDCLVKQCTIKQECPQCRKPCKPNKIIQLQNYN